MYSDARQDLQDTSVAWPGLIRVFRGEGWLIASFALASLAMVWLGHVFKVNAGNLTVMWPATGLLLAVLILAPRARWPLLIGIQLVAEYAMALVVDEPSLPTAILFFMLANTADAVIAALITRSQLWRFNVVRVSLALQFLLASAIGAAASATLGATIAAVTYGAGSYWEQWQLWWAGNWLGSLVITPPLLFWALPVRRRPKRMSSPTAATLAGSPT